MQTPEQYSVYRYLINSMPYEGNGNILQGLLQKVSEYDQEIPQSHTADQPTAPVGRATEHLQ